MTVPGLISVVMPVHNGARFIGRTLASALAQTYRLTEVIVVDDGSTDETAKVVEAVATNDDRVRLFRIEKSGVAAARNFGIAQSRGELIAPLDADDLWHPEKLSRQMHVMKSSPEKVGVVYCWSIEIDENDLLIRYPSKGQSAFRGNVTAELAKANFIGNSSSPLIRRRYLDVVGGYDTNLIPHGAEDWKLYLALSAVCEFAVVPDYLVGYRQHLSSLSRDVGMARSIELVSLWISERWPNLPRDVARKRLFYLGMYSAQRALDKNQFGAALRYSVGACRARPEGLFDWWTIAVAARFLFRLVGLRRAVFKRMRSRTPVSFKEFNALNDGRAYSAVSSC